MPEFTSPAITTKGNLGKVTLAPMFTLQAEYDPRTVSPTFRGGRVFQQIKSGIVSGQRLNGRVYPYSGADFGLLRERDQVEDIYARFMVRDDKGEWIYFEHHGYRRPDGYHRIQAYFDADSRGPYAWLNDAAVIATARASADGRQVAYDYFELL